MNVGSASSANAESSEAVEPGEGPLYHSAVDAKSGAVTGVPAGDVGDDAVGSDLATVDVVIVAAVREERVRLAV